MSCLPTLSRYCTICAAIAVELCLLSGCFNDANEYRDLAGRYKTVPGHISLRQCGNHMSVFYGFEVNGEKFGGRVPPTTLDCYKVVVGDPVTVYYDPLHPSVNTLMDPKQLYEKEHGYYLPIWLGLGIFIPLFLALRTINGFWGSRRISANRDAE